MGQIRGKCFPSEEETGHRARCAVENVNRADRNRSFPRSDPLRITGVVATGRETRINPSGPPSTSTPKNSASAEPTCETPLNRLFSACSRRESKGRPHWATRMEKIAPVGFRRSIVRNRVCFIGRIKIGGFPSGSDRHEKASDLPSGDSTGGFSG